jgi:hypothetical protein
MTGTGRHRWKNFSSTTSSRPTSEERDRRRCTNEKPYAIVGQEEGRGPKFTVRFATLEELRHNVLDRWQGWDYARNPFSDFHTDYCLYCVKGARLAGLVPPPGKEDYGDPGETER